MTKLFYILLVMLGGAASAVQSPVNAALGRRIGVLEGGMWSFITGAALLIALVLIFGKGQISLIPTAPKWQLIGGILGVIMVTSMIIATPHLGVGLTIVCVLLGQIILAMVIDAFGLFGVEPVPIDYNRIIGLLLILAGVFFVYRSKLGV